MIYNVQVVLHAYILIFPIIFPSPNKKDGCCLKLKKLF